MRPRWEDVTARVRGLAGHLLDPGQLAACRQATDPDTLGELLRRAGVVHGELRQPVRDADLELEVRRWAARALGVLGRWLGPRQVALPFLLADLDRRSIRAMLRGASERAPAERRLAGLIPTPALPERALETLAQSATAAGVVAHLSAWHHPVAPRLVVHLGVAEPDLFAMEMALAREVASQAVRAAKLAGDRALRRHVVETIDVENLRTAIVLGGEPADMATREHFLPGGRALDLATFEALVATGPHRRVTISSAAALAGLPCAGHLLHPEARVDRDDRMRRCRLQVVTRRVREAPLGPLAVIQFGLQLELQVIDLQRAIWTAALARPGGEVLPPVAGIR